MSSDTGTVSIAGIDTESALKRTGGKRERYESLLRKFAKQQADTVEVIRAALAEGDAAAAQRGAHSLKGAAGTLGATALAEVAAKAEAAVKAGEGVENALKSLSVSLAAVVQAISAALPDESTTGVAGPAPTDPTAAVRTLTRLNRLLENNDGEATDFVVQVRPGLTGVLTAAEIETLSELVGNYDFTAARVYLAEIAARLSLSLK